MVTNLIAILDANIQLLLEKTRQDQLRNHKFKYI